MVVTGYRFDNLAAFEAAESVINSAFGIPREGDLTTSMVSFVIEPPLTEVEQADFLYFRCGNEYREILGEPEQFEITVIGV